MTSTNPTLPALATLLPSLNQSQIPTKLISLANSLLAQSRNRASNLKPEEEIGRPYACAEIACTRLKGSLRLDVAKGRPPCKPAVYKKLLTFLEGVLREDEGRKSEATPTPRGRKRGAVGQPKNVTPSKTPKKQGDGGFVGTIQKAGVGGGKAGEEAPVWLMALIRKLCKEFDTPQLPPHVYTGVCVIMRLAEIWPQSASQDDVEFKADVSALTIATYLLVLTRMQTGDMTTHSYETKCESSLEIADLSKHEDGKGLVEEWIRRMNREEWCQGQDWWDSVPEEVIDVGNEEDLDLEDDVDVVKSHRRKRREREQRSHDEEDPDGVLLPGLGTMMQEAVDWLSEERRSHHGRWKDGVLKRIKPTEKSAGRSIAVR